MGQDRTDKDRTGAGAEPQRERAWARWRSGHLGCRPGLQLDNSTRRAVLAHDVTLGGGRGGGWAIGLSACLPVCCLSCGRLHLLQACGANPENGDRIRWLADQLFCPSFGPKQDQSPSYPAGSPRQKKRGTCLPTGRPTSLPHEPKLFIQQILRVDRRSGSSINHGLRKALGTTARSDESVPCQMQTQKNKLDEVDQQSPSTPLGSTSLLASVFRNQDS